MDVISGLSEGDFPLLILLILFFFFPYVYPTAPPWNISYRTSRTFQTCISQSVYGRLHN